jgi:hypothetical protein
VKLYKPRETIRMLALLPLSLFIGTDSCAANSRLTHTWRRLFIIIEYLLYRKVADGGRLAMWTELRAAWRKSYFILEHIQFEKVQ